MNKNYLYIGVGAVALIGIYMYIRNKGNVQPPPKKLGISSTQDIAQDTNQPKAVDDNQIIRECLAEFKNDMAKVKQCAITKGADWDAYQQKIFSAKKTLSAFKNQGLKKPSGSKLTTTPTLTCEQKVEQKYGSKWRTNPSVISQAMPFYTNCKKQEMGALSSDFAPKYGVEEESFAFNGHKF